MSIRSTWARYTCASRCASIPGALAALKRRLEPYPETYRREAIAKFLWECDFSLMCGRKAASKRDVLYASGSLFRSAVALVYALYAHYRMYCPETRRVASNGSSPAAWRCPMGLPRRSKAHAR